MMKILLTFSTLLTACFIAISCSAQNKETVGWVEYIRIYPGNFKIKARIDTGAKTSSIHAENKETFQRNGKEWVRFTITNKKGKSFTLEKEVIRLAKIKQKGLYSQKRLVIKLDICLGSVYKETEVNLVDRSNFNYPVLLGRSFLADHFVVDPSVTFIKKTKCKVPKGK